MTLLLTYNSLFYFNLFSRVRWSIHQYFVLYFKFSTPMVNILYITQTTYHLYVDTYSQIMNTIYKYFSHFRWCIQCVLIMYTHLFPPINPFNDFILKHSHILNFFSSIFSVFTNSIFQAVENLSSSLLFIMFFPLFFDYHLYV